MEGRLEPADIDYIHEQVRETWGLPIISVSATYEDTDGLEGLVWRDGAGDVRGLVTWRVDGGWAEVVTLDAHEQGKHIGGRLLDGAEAELRRRGARRIVLTTTNDNIRAIAFYLRRGYRIVAVELDGMTRVRAQKRGVSAIGHEGIPLRDMLLLEKDLAL